MAMLYSPCNGFVLLLVVQWEPSLCCCKQDKIWACDCHCQGVQTEVPVQAYYLQAPFPVERAPTMPVPGYSGSKKYRDVRVYQLAEYPVRGLVFECGHNLPDMADFVAEVCERLQKAYVPHNLFVVDCGLRVFLYPNGFAQAKAQVSCQLWILPLPRDGFVSTSSRYHMK